MPMKEVAPDVWQLHGFPPNAINVYLAGDALIDAGTRHADRRILRQVHDRPLSMLALTHVHPDHQGSVAAICEARGIPLACPADDVDAMEGREPIATGSAAFRAFATRTWAGPPRMVDRVLREGDEVAGFRVVHAPGHTPGEVIYFRDEDRVAICGDVINTVHIWTGIPGLHQPPGAFTADPDENRRSIRKLVELGPSVVCPGHGAPYRDLEKLEIFARRVR